MALTEHHLCSKNCCKFTRLHNFHYFSIVFKNNDLQRAHNGIWLWLFIQTYLPSFSIAMILHHLHKFLSYLKCKTGVKWKMCLGSRVSTQAVSPHWAPAVPACHTQSCCAELCCTCLQSVWVQCEHTPRDTRLTAQGICTLPVNATNYKRIRNKDRITGLIGFTKHTL